jgi:hypothetical protein
MDTVSLPLVDDGCVRLVGRKGPPSMRRRPAQPRLVGNVEKVNGPFKGQSKSMKERPNHSTHLKEYP